MPQFHCLAECYLNHEGRYQHYMPGEVVRFDKVPPAHFEEMAERSVDFMNDSQDFILESDWKPAELKKFLKDKFGAELKGKMTKLDMINKLMYTRDNSPEVE